MHANLNSYSHQNPPFLSYKFFICIYFSSFFSRLIPSNPIQGIRNTMSREYYEFIENYKLFIIFTNNNNDEGDDHHNATNVFFYFKQKLFKQDVYIKIIHIRSFTYFFIFTLYPLEIVMNFI